MHEIVTGPPPALFSRLAGKILEFRTHEKFARITVLTPDRQTRNVVRDALPVFVAQEAPPAGPARAGLFNVRITYLPPWAGEIARLRIEHLGLGPLPRSASLAVISEAVRRTRHQTKAFEVDGATLDPRDRPSFLRAVLREIVDLKKACVSPCDLRERSVARYCREIAAIYDASETILQSNKWVDQSEILALATERLITDPCAAGEDLYLFFGFLHLNELEKRCLGALADAASRACAYVPSVPGGVAFAVAEPTIALFETKWGITRSSIPAKSGVAREIVGDLFCSDAEEVHENPAICVASAPEPAQEIREAARWIWRVIEEDDSRFQDFQVIVPDNRHSARFAADVLRKAGIPVNVAFEEPLSDTDAGRGLMLFLEAVESGLLRTRVMDLLSACRPRGTHPPGEQARSVTSSDWDRIARLAGVSGGIRPDRSVRSEWDDRLARYECALAWRIEHQPTEGEENAVENVASLRREHEATRELRQLIHELDASREAIESASSWEGWVAAVKQGWQKTAEVRGSEEVRQIELVLDEIATYDAAGKLPPAPVRWIILAEALGHRRVSTARSDPHGVTLTNLAGACIRPCRALVMVALSDGEFPRTTARTALSVQPDDGFYHEFSGLPLDPQKAIDCAMFAMALSAASDRVRLSYSRRTDTAMGEKLPSSALMEVIRRVIPLEESSPVASLWDENALHRELSERGEWAVREPVPKPKECWLNAQELILAHAASAAGTSAGEEIAGRVGRHARDGMALLRARDSFPGPYDGWFAERAMDDVLLNHVSSLGTADNPLSARALETYAECPFRFLVMRILKTEPLPEPEIVLDFSGMDSGLVLHELLAEFFRRLIREQLFPQRPASVRNLRPLFDELAERKRRELERGGTIPPGAIWQIRWTALLESAWAAIAWSLGDARSWEPSLVEVGFGVPGGRVDEASSEDPAYLPLPDGGTLAVRGIIDRVDFCRETSCARVLDYKSGRKPRTLNGLTNSGRLVQALLYARMLNQWLQEKALAKEVSEAWYLYLRNPVKTDDTDSVPIFDTLAFSAEKLRDGQEELDGVLSVIIRCMRGGFFLPLPQDPPNGEHCTCAHCDVAVACGSLSGLTSRWKRYQKDTRGACFLSLRSKGGAP
ncbi:MAG: ATP-dependent helicase/deoxyribonuclease subunit B [Candidatus Latescibacteria bacterium ADurb.Bin168]|nr:MAG: ATP-dependent helicase/deoxyribonuclease subunit B [Candidatus Latescibacteria bacterium ADurb.Bin168]